MRLKERLAGIENDDELPGLVETYLAEGHEGAVRQALPELIEERPGVAAELSAILERLRAEPVARAETIVEGSATALACGTCGGALTVQAPDTAVVVCPYCGTENDPRTGNLGHRWDAVLDPESPFHIGTFFERDGRPWQVVGLQHWRGTIREWDLEDSTWETNPAEYTVWWMLDGQRRLAYLGDDGRKRYWSEPVVPDDPGVPDAASKGHEHGEWELVDVAGELSYRPRPGERLLTTERMRGATGTSVERRLGPDGEPVEIEFYRERLMDDDAVLEGLGDARALARVRTWRRRSLWFAGSGAVLALCFLVLKLVFPSTSAFETTVNQTSPDRAAFGPDGSALGGFRADGPFPSHELGVRLRGSLPENNRSLDIELRLASADGAVDVVVPFGLWHESGRDADGRWSETRYAVAHTLRLPVPSDYEVFLMTLDTDVPNALSFEVTVTSNAFGTTPVTLGLIGALIAFFACRLKAAGALGGAVSLAHVPRARGRDHVRHHGRDPERGSGPAGGDGSGDWTAPRRGFARAEIDR